MKKPEARPRKQTKAERKRTLALGFEMNKLLSIPTETLTERQIGSIDIIAAVMADEVRRGLMKDGIHLPSIRTRVRKIKK